MISISAATAKPQLCQKGDAVETQSVKKPRRRWYGYTYALKTPDGSITTVDNIYLRFEVGKAITSWGTIISRQPTGAWCGIGRTDSGRLVRYKNHHFKLYVGKRLGMLTDDPITIIEAWPAPVEGQEAPHPAPPARKDPKTKGQKKTGRTQKTPARAHVIG